jgi:hypothetical protein
MELFVLALLVTIFVVLLQIKQILLAVAIEYFGSKNKVKAKVKRARFGKLQEASRKKSKKKRVIIEDDHEDDDDDYDDEDD